MSERRLADGSKPWVVWAILLVALTAVLLVVMARKSQPLAVKEGRR